MNKSYKYLTIFILLPIISLAQWLPSRNGMQMGSCLSASFLSNNAFIVNLNGLLLTTQNGGLEFDTIKNFPPQVVYNMVYKSKDTLFVASEGTKGLLKSVDAGQTWETQILLLPNGDTAFKNTKIIYFGFFDSSHGIVFGDKVNGLQQVFLSDNGGDSWYFYTHHSIIQSIRFSLAYRGYSNYNKYIFESGKAKFLVGDDAILLSLSENGRIWQADTNTVSRLNITKIAFKDELNGLANITVPDSGGLLFKTSDGGISWSKIHDSAFRVGSNIQYVKGTTQKPGFYYAKKAGKSKGNDVSYNDGKDWVRFDSLNSDGVFFRNIEAGICSDIGVTTSKLYYYDPINTSIKHEDKDAQNKLILYPNPANDMLYFNQFYQSIQIFDTQGKIILQQIQQAKSIDISTLGSGLYVVYTTNITGEINTQKLMVQH